MSKRYINSIRIFFSDYVSWLLIIACLFIVSLVAVVAFGNANGFIWIIPVMFLIILCLCLPFPLLILYCKVRKDLKHNNIDKLTVKIAEIQQYDKFEFKNRVGATVGKRKYRIIDENDNYYLLSTANDKDMFLIFHPDLSFSVEVEVLNKSRLVLSMKLMEEPKTKKAARKQNYNIARFKKVFSHYF